MIIHLDFETRSACSLKDQGLHNYATDPTTEILVMAYAIGKNLVNLYFPKYFGDNDLPEDLENAIYAPGLKIEAFNAGFEYAIWQHICVKKYGWPRLPDSVWFCSQAVSNYYAIAKQTSLENVAIALKLNQKKDEVGHKLMLQMTKRRKPTKNNKARYVFSQEKLMRLAEYCKQDVKTARAVTNTLGFLPNYEQQIWQLDQKMNRRGIYADRKLTLAAVKLEREILDEVNSEIYQLTHGKIRTVTQTKAITNYLRQQVPQLTSLNRDYLEQQDLTRYPENVQEILKLRLDYSLSSVKKYKAITRLINEDDRLRHTMMYHGAHTGRWVSMNVQVQNFLKYTFKNGDQEIREKIHDVKTLEFEELTAKYGNVLTLLSQLTRPVLQAPKGKKLIWADFAGIENRILFWLCGETEALQKIRDKQDLYVDLARVIFNKNDINKNERDLGKRAVLGCGYGMNAGKFQTTCAKYKQPITLKLAKKTVRAFRKKYRKVVAFWYDLDRLLQRIRLQPNKWIKFKNIDVALHWDKVALQIRVPNGRVLHYYKPDFDQIYGGLLTNNIVQKIARDLLVDAMLRIDQAGYNLIFTVHDEIILEEPETTELAEIMDLMVEVPPWANGLPVGAEIFESRYYQKR